MKKILFSVISLFLAVGAVSAMSTDCQGDVCPPAAQTPDDGPGDRKQWFKEVREFKHNFLAKELNLTKEQQKAFFPLYDAMEDETWKINRETRELESKVASSAKATDLEYDKATDAIYEQKEKEGAVERAYMQKFRQVLSREQLFKLKSAERRFARKLMQHHNRLTGEKGGGRKGQKGGND